MTGMLWYDPSKASIEDKIKKALEYYNGKYITPEVCLINPKDAADIDLEALSKACGTAVKTWHMIQLNTILIGKEGNVERMLR
jgi:hypothetical protein